MGKFVLLLCYVGLTLKVNAQQDVRAAYRLIKRIVPQQAAFFKVESLPRQDEKDVFEIESSANKITLRGNNGVSVAAALYYYLTEYCHSQITWNGTHLHLPEKLPVLKEKVRRQTPYQYRYYLNYCTFNYSMSWWDWIAGKKRLTGWHYTALICHWLLPVKNTPGTRYIKKWALATRS